MSVERRVDVAAALSEAVTNVVRHAYPGDQAGEVLVEAATDGEWLTVRVADDGTGPESTDTPGGSSLGLGLPLMEWLADRLEFSEGPRGVGTVVLMEFAMAARPAESEVRVADLRDGERRRVVG